MRGLIVGWALGAGVSVALVDILTRELIRVTQNADLATALNVVALYSNIGLCGWAAYRVAGALREGRPGLETAVAAGLVSGILAIAYNVVRHVSTLAAPELVQLLALNILYAALGGAAGAWVGSRRRPNPTDGG